MAGRFPLSGGFAEANLHIIFFDSKLAHFEHYSEQQLEQYSGMKNTIAVNKDGWGVQVGKADYEPEVFTFSSDKYCHYPQNITRTGMYCYLGLLNGVKNATDSEKRNFMFGFSINEINSSLPRSQIISIITFVAQTFYSLSFSLIVWHLYLPKIIFWRELASFFSFFIVLVQVLRYRSSIAAENMQSFFNVSLLAFYFKADNIVTPLILGLSLLQPFSCRGEISSRLPGRYSHILRLFDGQLLVCEEGLGQTVQAWCAGSVGKDMDHHRALFCSSHF
jgi:hypothetical protein